MNRDDGKFKTEIEKTTESEKPKAERVQKPRPGRTRRLFLAAILSTILMPGAAVGVAKILSSKIPRLRDLLRRRVRRVLPSLTKKPGGIVIHHSATRPSRQNFVSVKTLDSYHQKRGMGVSYEGKTYHVAYHYVILPNGEIQEGRPVGCRGAHTRSWSHNYWVGICLVGYFDPKWKNKKYHRPTGKQMDSLVNLSADLINKYDLKLKNVLPHRKVNPTECPGRSFPFKEYLSRLRVETEKRSDPSRLGRLDHNRRVFMRLGRTGIKKAKRDLTVSGRESIC